MCFSGLATTLPPSNSSAMGRAILFLLRSIWIKNRSTTDTSQGLSLVTRRNYRRPTNKFSTKKWTMPNRDLFLISRRASTQFICSHSCWGILRQQFRQHMWMVDLVLQMEQPKLWTLNYNSAEGVAKSGWFQYWIPLNSS
jgi:hypothetical protein